jgi:hypothetical protein
MSNARSSAVAERKGLHYSRDASAITSHWSLVNNIGTITCAIACAEGFSLGDERTLSTMHISQQSTEDIE